MSLSYERDIRPLFLESDRESMDWRFDLWSHGDVSANSQVILERLSEGTMPCDRTWPDTDVEKFRQWVAEGTPP
jgi:hypothetical protein